MNKCDFKQYDKAQFVKDIMAGIIVALISIPISMGYAQVSGLPVVYGLYGSLIPILIYGFVASSLHIVFGVDAAPAALTGGLIASFGIISGSEDAMRIIPVITLVTACWLLVFFFIHAGKLVNYISTPVMGGFISGIGCTIILMQVPKLFGGTPGSGEFFSLMANIVSQLDKFNALSFVLGISTVVIILIMKKIMPKFPMPVVMLAFGALLTAIFHIDRQGVALLPAVEGGLPHFILPDVRVLTSYHWKDVIISGLTIALVIIAQTLLTANNYAMKYGYKVNNDREILAYSAGNMASAFIGCCPVGGSVSRTGMADQFGCKSQVMSVAASVTMLFVLLFGTGIIKFLPVPVLTGIVMAALIGILEFGLAKKLWKTSRSEFLIFMAAFLGVMIFGTIYGVAIGIVLSFIAVIIRAVIPPRDFLGIIPGHQGFYSLKRNRNAKPIKGTLIYRFSGTLFFANINTFQEDIESAITDDTKQVIVDASGIGSVDITAADRLLIINDNLKKKGIRFYITEHVGDVNDQFRMLGAERLVDEGVVRRTISLALRDSGVSKPYPVDGGYTKPPIILETSEQLAEFEWAFGKDADEKMDHIAAEIAENMVATNKYDMETLKKAENGIAWGRIGLYDEDELLDRIEVHLKELTEKGNEKAEAIEEKIEQRRTVIEHKLHEINPESLAMLRNHRRQVATHLREINPKAYDYIIHKRIEHIKDLEKNDESFASEIKKLYHWADENGNDLLKSEIYETADNNTKKKRTKFK